MGLHQALAADAQFGVAAEQFGMDQIHRADVERRRHVHATPERHQAIDEVEAGATQVKTAVDMRGLDVKEPRGSDRLGETNEQSHCESGGLAMLACEEGSIERGKFKGHLRQASGAALGRSMRVAVPPQSRRSLPAGCRADRGDADAMRYDRRASARHLSCAS